MKAILIYGPTASGKSSLAIKLALKLNAAIVNADALQVYSNWQVLSARPDADELAQAPHHLYGHVSPDQSYSAGAWLRDVKATLHKLDQTAIILGGTGLYFTALTYGLAEIPETAPEIRDAGNQLRQDHGAEGFVAELQTLDPDILTRIDKQNPMRLQRAWEVAKSTGKPLSEWQADTSPPILPLSQTCHFCLNATPDWQRARIDARFGQMIQNGALQECQRALEAGWNPSLPSSQAIGAKELIAHLNGEISLDEATDAAKIATHQYAKRQRTWMKNRMKSWAWLNSDDPNLLDAALEQIEIFAAKGSDSL